MTTQDDWLKRALTATPNGSQTRSKSAAAYGLGAIPCPYVTRARGAYLWTADGRKYLDWVGALGAVTLGYRHPAVEDAIKRQLRDGTIYSMPHRLEVEISERFAASVPAGRKNGQVRWLKTGSEATQAAVRIARMATKREMILTSDQSYHSWHDWFTASRPQSPGVPDCLRDCIATFRYNDLDDLRAVLQRTGAHRIAAVMLEPTLFEAPRDSFLEGVKKITHEIGALLIFDEMILGARLAWGGGSEYFEVMPDLATYGKAIGGGLPLACVVGPERYLRLATVVSGTFGGDALALAACAATMDVYEVQRKRSYHHSIPWRLYCIGEDLITRITARAAAEGIIVAREGYGIHPRLRFTVEPEKSLALFVETLADAGILWHPAGLNPMLAHGEREIDKTVQAAWRAFRRIAEAQEMGRWMMRTKLPESGLAVRTVAG